MPTAQSNGFVKGASDETPLSGQIFIFRPLDEGRPLSLGADHQQRANDSRPLP
jgi:hypothetical protein